MFVLSLTGHHGKVLCIYGASTCALMAAAGLSGALLGPGELAAMATGVSVLQSLAFWIVTRRALGISTHPKLFPASVGRGTRPLQKELGR